MATNKKTSVLFLLPYPVGHAPSQRFRVEQYFRTLDDAQINYALAPFLNESTWKILYKGGSPLSKAAGVVKSFLSRWKTVLFDVPKYDYIFVHREAAPLGPPIFEWVTTKLWRKKLIFDFDDAIWIPNTSAENKIAAALKAFWKIKYICRWTYKAAGGNDYLCRFAKESGAAQPVRIPTIVDTDNRYVLSQTKQNKQLVIGWTGSHSTLKYIDEVIPVLQTLQESYDFTFRVIADKEPSLPLKNWEYVPWNPASEIEDLSQIDIGLMPLTDDKWSEGKCGFKLIQYMALGIPAVASPVGVNNVIIENNINGFVASAAGEWKTSLEILIKDAALRRKMGLAGRQKIVAGYSLASQKQAFLNLFS